MPLSPLCSGLDNTIPHWMTAMKRKRGKRAAARPKLLSGGNPQISKADGDAPVRAYIAAMPGWKRDVGRRLDALIARTVPNVRKAVRWNKPFYGIEGRGWFLAFHCFTKYVKVTFLRGAALASSSPLWHPSTKTCATFTSTKTMSPTTRSWRVGSGRRRRCPARRCFDGVGGPAGSSSAKAGQLHTSTEGRDDTDEMDSGYHPFRGHRDSPSTGDLRTEEPSRDRQGPEKP